MRKIILNDTVVDELAFDTLFHLSQPDKTGLLSAKELRAIKNARTARTYAGQMSLDEKLILFAKIGISFSFIIHNTDWKLKKFVAKYKDLTKGQRLDRASKEKVIVVNNRMVANFLSVMSDLTHSDGYLLNMDFHRVGNFVNTWKDGRPDTDSLAEALDYAKMINKLALVQNMATKEVRGKTDIGDLDLNILMYLYDLKERYVPRGTIEGYFGGMYKKTIIGAAIKRLAEKCLIDRNPTTRTPEYQITSFGITATMDFHTKNLKAI